MTADINTPDLCAARAADPAWRAEQEVKRQAASATFTERRASIGLPIVRKQAGERF